MDSDSSSYNYGWKWVPPRLVSFIAVPFPPSYLWEERVSEKQDPSGISGHVNATWKCHVLKGKLYLKWILFKEGFNFCTSLVEVEGKSLTGMTHDMARHLKDFDSKGEIFLEKLRSLRTEAPFGLEKSSLGQAWIASVEPVVSIFLNIYKLQSWKCCNWDGTGTNIAKTLHNKWLWVISVLDSILACWLQIWRFWARWNGWFQVRSEIDTLEAAGWELQKPMCDISRD